MALATRTVSINAAFLQEIKDDHHELRQLMHHTAAMLARPTAILPEQGRLVELLTKLRDQLAMHFSLEEAYGYFEDAIEVAPHLCRRADLLRSEHAGLYGELCALVELAEQLLYDKPTPRLLVQLAEDYGNFEIRFREHEARENDLILEAFNDDIGAGD